MGAPWGKTTLSPQLKLATFIKRYFQPFIGTTTSNVQRAESGLIKRRLTAENKADAILMQLSQQTRQPRGRSILIFRTIRNSTCKQNKLTPLGDGDLNKIGHRSSNSIRRTAAQPFRTLSQTRQRGPQTQMIGMKKSDSGHQCLPALELPLGRGSRLPRCCHRCNLTIPDLLNQTISAETAGHPVTTWCNTIGWSTLRFRVPLFPRGRESRLRN
jgi:hypothetical protein